MKLLNFMTRQVEFRTGKRTRKQGEEVAGKSYTNLSVSSVHVQRSAKMAYLVVLKIGRVKAYYSRKINIAKVDFVKFL